MYANISASHGYTFSVEYVLAEQPFFLSDILYNLDEWELRLSATFYICFFECIESVE